MTRAGRGRRQGIARGSLGHGLACGLIAAASISIGAGCRAPGSRTPAEEAGAAGAVGPVRPIETEAPASIEGPASIGAASIEAAATEMRPVDAWSGSRLLRQRVRVEWPSGSEVFDAVLQRRPGELALFGLGPMNLVGFRLALVEGPRIEFENRSGRALPFAPAHILADVQRVYYPWLAEPWSPEPADCPAGCERSGRVGSIAVWERRVEGRLVQRRFALAERLEAGSVHIRYADWQGDPGHPRRVELDNGWFGYRLAIETLEETPLAGP